MYEILINILIFCLILLLIALIVAAVQGILILFDFRSISKEVRKKFLAVTSAIDIAALLLGGVDEAKKRFKKKLKSDRPTLMAFLAGVKKGLQVLLESKGGKENG